MRPSLGRLLNSPITRTGGGKVNHKYRLFVLIAVAVSFSFTGAEAYDFALRVSRSQFPIIEGRTNAPDGSTFIVVLKRPWLPDGNARLARGLSACGDDCFPAIDHTGAMGARVIVKNGGFFAGPFSFAGKPIAAGIYPIEISPWIDQRTAPIKDLKEITAPILSGQIKIDGANPSDKTAESFAGGGQNEENTAVTNAAPSHTSSQTNSVFNKQPKWETIPLHDRDGNYYAYDKNSVIVTNDRNGQVNGADVRMIVVKGDSSIQGKIFVLSFDCSGRYRINHSYPIPLPSGGPEMFVGNITCGIAKCEIWRRQDGKPVCK